MKALPTLVAAALLTTIPLSGALAGEQVPPRPTMAAGGSSDTAVRDLDLNDLTGINPAKTAAVPEAADPGLSPEMIDLLVDGVIAKLRAKPEILVDIVLSYEERHKQPSGMIRPDDPAIGPQDADVTLVHFFDPSCPPCRATATALEQAAAADGKVRVVIKEFPTTAEGLATSLAALAAKDYNTVHAAVLSGLQPQPVKDQTAVAKASAAIAQNREIAAKYRVSVLPTIFAVGNGMASRIEGPLTAAEVVAKLKAIRGKTAGRTN